MSAYLQHAGFHCTIGLIDDYPLSPSPEASIDVNDGVIDAVGDGYQSRPIGRRVVVIPNRVRPT